LPLKRFIFFNRDCEIFLQELRAVELNLSFSQAEAWEE